MKTGSRRGVIGFMLTMALGVALGAATLVVGNEVAKEIKTKKGRKQGPSTNIPPASGQKPDTTPAATNPFGEDILITPDQGSQSGAAQDLTVPVPPPPDAAATSANPDPAMGLEYIRVRSGDSLFKICQQYYGDGGMWQHILRYQIPSIAACPNLIYPGQLIALPRRLTTGQNTGSFPPADQGSQPGTANPLPPAAAGDESWQERFQKDYVVSDFTLTNSGSMSVAQIQRFLEKKGSVLAKPYRGSTPAKMIFDAAKKHGINPQVLLTRLQCEQGLVSARSATQKRLDWALGVGCYDSGNWNQKFKGLDKQIDWAAATYKRHYADAKAKLDRKQPVVMNIDGQSVRVKNAATYSFYKYCPHFHGNKLFFDVWRGYRSFW